MVLSFVGGRLGAPLDPEEVRQLDLGTFSSFPGSPPGVLPTECGCRSGTSKKVEETSPFILGEALRVVPTKLVRKIVQGDFVDMAELLQDNMEVERRKQQVRASPPKVAGERCQILSWLQCFSLYAAVLGAQFPEKSKDLLAYQALMISEHWRCGGRGWILYDSAICQQISNIREADFSVPLPQRPA